jgi:hypothetical protein
MLKFDADLALLQHFFLFLQQKLREWAASQQKASYFALDLHHPCAQI